MIQIPENRYIVSKDVEKVLTYMASALANSRYASYDCETNEVCRQAAEQAGTTLRRAGWYTYLVRRGDGVITELRAYSKPCDQITENNYFQIIRI